MQFQMLLSDTDKHYDLSIHASTLEKSIICLDYLVGLKDTHFREMDLTCIEDYDNMTRLCPFGANIVEKILQNSARRIIFSCIMIFTADHCRNLASCGTKTDIEFNECELQDEGAAFVEASAARQDTSGPAKLRFYTINPCNDSNWALFLSQHTLESLALDCIDLESEVSCRALATPKVRYLTLSDECELEDGGAALVGSITKHLFLRLTFCLSLQKKESKSVRQARTWSERVLL
jgi:hypothetical protein